jgi:phosphoribosylformimino-5-aminoimidazole carboxamide ribotide isomerase
VLLIPAIDVRAGRCVRLYQGDFTQETPYLPHATQILRRYRSLGAHWIHVVDLDGAREGVRANQALISQLAGFWSVRLQVGGGVRSVHDIEALLDCGVARVVVGSAALHRFDEVTAWLKHFGAERLCLAFDVQADASGELCVRTHGWKQHSGVSLWTALSRYPPGSVRHILCTDIERDGALSGPNLDLYATAVARFPNLAWQASGGVRDAADLWDLARTGVIATVSGKALLEDRIPHSELRAFLPDASSPVSTSATARS